MQAKACTAAHTQSLVQGCFFFGWRKMGYIQASKNISFQDISFLFAPFRSMPFARIPCPGHGSSLRACVRACDRAPDVDG